MEVATFSANKRWLTHFQIYQADGDTLFRFCLLAMVQLL